MGEEDQDVDFLASVDPRLLTSISLSLANKAQYRFFQQLESLGNLGELRALKMDVQQPTFDSFIEGEFSSSILIAIWK